MKNTFVVSCPIDTFSGYGARSRDFVKALIELGFEEVYQGVDYGEAGYIFYSHEIKGVGFYSLGTDEEDFHVRMDDSEYEVRNLSKLRDLILSLNEL